MHEDIHHGSIVREWNRNLNLPFVLQSLAIAPFLVKNPVSPSLTEYVKFLPTSKFSFSFFLPRPLEITTGHNKTLPSHLLYKLDKMKTLQYLKDFLLETRCCES